MLVLPLNWLLDLQVCTFYTALNILHLHSHIIPVYPLTPFPHKHSLYMCGNVAQKAGSMKMKGVPCS